jgi:hypothetical protein
MGLGNADPTAVMRVYETALGREVRALDPVASS